MKKICDLHVHTTASDGQYTPAQVIELARQRGIQVLAITDHDTIDGLCEAEKVGTQLGIQVLRGIELSAKEHKNLHILGYDFSPEAPSIRKLCAFKQEQRELRNQRMVDFLLSKGLHISLDEVAAEAGGQIIGRPHFARVLLQKGYVATIREAFDQYLDTEEYNSIRVSKVSAEECIAAIKADGGKVSLAHPYQLGYADEILTELVSKLKSYGLDAMECYYPKHTPEQSAFYLKLARQFDLHITGGSDFHGEKVKPEIELARIELNLNWLL